MFIFKMSNSENELY